MARSLSVVALLWAGWALVWLIAALRVKPVERRESVLSRLVHLVPLGIAALLLSARAFPGWLGTRFAPADSTLTSIALIVVGAGLALAVWGRVALGGNWSGTVTLKKNHAIVRIGPYRSIRHPIYAGLLLATLGTALALGEWRGVLATLLVAAALWRKIRLEERWLEGAFGAVYSEYRAATWAIVPFVF